MRISLTITIIRPVLALLFAATAFAHQHTALNGIWILVPAQSNFAGQPVTETGRDNLRARWRHNGLSQFQV